MQKVIHCTKKKNYTIGILLNSISQNTRGNTIPKSFCIFLPRSIVSYSVNTATHHLLIRSKNPEEKANNSRAKEKKNSVIFPKSVQYSGLLVRLFDSKSWQGRQLQRLYGWGRPLAVRRESILKLKQCVKQAVRDKAVISEISSEHSP